MFSHVFITPKLSTCEFNEHDFMLINKNSTHYFQFQNCSNDYSEMHKIAWIKRLQYYSSTCSMFVAIFIYLPLQDCHKSWRRDSKLVCLLIPKIFRIWFLQALDEEKPAKAFPIPLHAWRGDWNDMSGFGYSNNQS